ncbi:MAG TPA: ATP-binding protein [Vicinamibacterales bacterium]|nr:ATP-binding protein [Vicinamibacterales bacterium]
MSTMRRKLLWLIGGRVAVVTVLLGSAILIQIKTPEAFPTDPFFFLIGLTYALTAIWALTLKVAERQRWLVDVQLACDAIIVSAIVYLTGGVGSYFSSLYTLPIIAASVVQSGRGGLMAGVLSSVLYGGLVLAQYDDGLLPAMEARDVLPPLRIALFTVGLNVFGFLAVATLSGYLAEGLRRTGEQLEQASSQLADLQAFSAHVINSLLSGLATTDLDGRMLTVNTAAEGIIGMPAAEAVGRPAMEVLQLPPVFATLFGPGATRTALPRLEYGFAKADGRQIELGISTAVLRTPRGDGGLLLTFQDVTDAKKHEREARVQQRLAAVGEMAAGIAHEIRNPLASMAGSIQMLRDELPLTAEQSQLMDIVLRESDRLNGTIRSFLAYAKPHRAAFAPVDVRQVVVDTARLLQNSSECSERHEIAVDVPDGAVWYQADEGQIRQILWNLATNGLRAMPAGGRLRLHVAEDVDGPDARGEVAILVEDDGVGIPAEDLDGIFQPFRGAFARGTGLGLSIVHRIVSDYGGELQVTSAPGQGTAVRVKLPLGQPVVAA